MLHLYMHYMFICTAVLSRIILLAETLGGSRLVKVSRLSVRGKLWRIS
jgi:hypothetical protein